MKKQLLLLVLLLVQLLTLQAADSTKVDTLRHQVLLSTSKGDIVVELYNETPFIATTSSSSYEKAITTASCGIASLPIS